MSTKTVPKRQALPDAATLINSRYGCGPVQFAGTDEALYERHLLFDSGVAIEAATARDRFEALARSVRDILSQRWLLTEKTYEQQNPKRLYYLSMEFLIGRSLQNNVTNLLLAPVSHQVIEEKKLNLLEILEQEPDAGLGNGGLGRLAACFVESAATMQLPAMGYGLRYEYGIFRQSIRNGWQQETPELAVFALNHKSFVIGVNRRGDAGGNDCFVRKTHHAQGLTFVRPHEQIIRLATGSDISGRKIEFLCDVARRQRYYYRFRRVPFGLPQSAPQHL